MTIQKLGVVGAGIMGIGIAQVAAAEGLQIILKDVSKPIVAASLQKLSLQLERDVKKERVGAEQAKTILANISASDKWEDFKCVDFVVEAVAENLGLKKECFAQLDAHCPSSTVLATNTSTLSITEIAASTRRPEKVIGMHFMNPVPLMKLVEIIAGLRTSPQTIEETLALAARLKKTPAQAKDFPGFISNRILVPMINEAIFCLMEGVGTREAIDTVMKLGMNHPMGPLALADMIGLDTLLSVMEILHQGFSDSKYRPCPLLRNMVKAGHLGKKSGKGFYDYAS